jgi:hypothetical protein
MMKHAVMASVLLLAASIPAASQAIPRFETYFGYSYVRFTPDNLISDFHANGGTAQFLYNFNPHFGLVGDFGGYHVGGLNGILGENVANFQFGPRISFRKKKTVSPYVQVLVGGIWASETPFPNLAPQFGGSETTFALLAGGGLDIKLSRHFSFRPFEVDYFLTRLRNPLTDSLENQNNLRASAGFSFRLAVKSPRLRPRPPGRP